MTALDIALEYIGRGWSPIPIPHKKKKPVSEEWPGWRITKETAHQRFNGGPQNIGVIMGEASAGLADVDLDTIEAVRAGPYFLPRTQCFGRTSKPRSHWLYQSGLWQTEDKAAIQFKFATGSGKDRKEQMILELRIGGGGKGAQTVFPGSVHETGELIAWDGKEDIARAEGDNLKQRCERAASAALLAEHFPSKGARHDAGLTLGGFLSRCGFLRPDAELFAEAVTIASGQPREKVKDVRKATGEAWDEASRPGGRARGFPALAETFGDDVAKHVAKWLAYQSGPDRNAPNDEPFYDGGAWEMPPGPDSRANGEDSSFNPIIAKPYIYRDPRSIPPRQFLHAGHYIRGFLSATIAPGGLGKTSLQLVEAVGMAIGRDLLKGITSSHKLKVWYWNLEDPRDEIDRRIAAIILHYDINPSTIEQLFINSEEPLVIATRNRDATVVAEPVVNGLVSEINRLQIDALIIDPFVSSHKVPENDNNAIDTVAKTWSGIGRAQNCAIELAHHIRKPASGSTAEITVDDGRGAGSLKDAGRSVRVLNTMSKEEAETVGIKPDQRRRYFRVEAGKANMKPPAEIIEWRKLVSVPLDNATLEDEGDWVGVVTKWKMPGALEGVTASDLFRVQKRVSEDKWREDSRAMAWVGKAVAETLNLNVREPAVKKRILGMIKIWLETGALRIVEADDDRRHKREFVEVGEWAT